MFCPECGCEFVGWTGKCPNCNTPLVEGGPAVGDVGGKQISYEALVDLVRENGGQLGIDVSTCEVGRERKWRFPWLGYGRAWAKRMQGAWDDILVDLRTTEVGRDSRWTFPYFGYGFGWARKMQGPVGGNEIVLTATKVSMERRWGFPWLGYGYAWTREMSGECGAQLTVRLTTTDVRRHRKWGFPYFGYGFAWAHRGVLTLTLREQSEASSPG